MTRVRTERQVMSPAVAEAVQVLADTIAEVRTLAEARAARPAPGTLRR